MRRQAGFIVADFIFAIVVASFMGVLLFGISYSLTVVEITQYVSFATSRAHMAGNKDPEGQRQKALRKFSSLTTGRTALGRVYNNGWFKIDRPDIRSGPSGGATGNSPTFRADLAGGSDMPDRNWFIGVSIPLTLKLLSFNIPFLGNTTPDSPEGLKTHVSAMLIRDPSQSECQEFMAERQQALGNLPSGQRFYDQGAYVPIEDNGC